MVEKVERVELVAVREGSYTIYVFKKVEDSEYIMCTRLPNWNVPDVHIGEKGFLNYQIVKAGETYYNPSIDETVKYQYSNIYFINFIKESDVTDNDSIII
jgi:hypothetical protein